MNAMNAYNYLFWGLAAGPQIVALAIQALHPLSPGRTGVKEDFLMVYEPEAGWAATD